MTCAWSLQPAAPRALSSSYAPVSTHAKGSVPLLLDCRVLRKEAERLEERSDKLKDLGVTIALELHRKGQPVPVHLQQYLPPEERTSK